MDECEPVRDAQADAGLTAMCADHLQREEALLSSALRILRAVLAAFTTRGLEAFASALQGHADFAIIASEMNAQRRRFRDEAARRLKRSDAVTLTQLLAALSADDRAPVAAAAARVRRLAQELADLNFRVSVHLRVYLNAYRRILRDLTNTTPSSGRYGPAGTTESSDFRPLLLVHG